MEYCAVFFDVSEGDRAYFHGGKIVGGAGRERILADAETANILCCHGLEAKSRKRERNTTAVLCCVHYADIMTHGRHCLSMLLKVMPDAF